MEHLGELSKNEGINPRLTSLKLTAGSVSKDFLLVECRLATELSLTLARFPRLRSVEYVSGTNPEDFRMIHALAAANNVRITKLSMEAFTIHDVSASGETVREVLSSVEDLQMASLYDANCMPYNKENLLTVKNLPRLTHLQLGCWDGDRHSYPDPRPSGTGLHSPSFAIHAKGL